MLHSPSPAVNGDLQATAAVLAAWGQLCQLALLPAPRSLATIAMSLATSMKLSP